jgi:hypothetical protein
MKKFAALLWGEVKAQVNPVDTNLYRVLKYNNQEYIGRIVSDDGREVLLETSALGKIFLVKSEIQSITIIHREIDFVGDEYRGIGVFTTQLSSQLSSKRYSFPVPMCTWFYKF